MCNVCCRYIYWKIIEVDEMIDPLNRLLSDGDQDFVRLKVNEIKKEAKYEQIANETIMLLDALRLVSLMTHPATQLP